MKHVRSCENLRTLEKRSSIPFRWRIIRLGPVVQDPRYFLLYVLAVYMMKLTGKSCRTHGHFAISSVWPANAISPFGCATRKRPINKYARVINWIAIRQDGRALLNFHRGSPYTSSWIVLPQFRRTFVRLIIYELQRRINVFLS